MTEKRSPTTTPDWQAAVRRRTRFYTLIALLLAILFGVLVFQLYSHQGPRISIEFLDDTATPLDKIPASINTNINANFG